MKSEGPLSTYKLKKNLIMISIYIMPPMPPIPGLAGA
jgi:hypothetical protein